MQKIIALILFILFSNISFSQSAKIEFSAKENTIDYGKVTKATDSGIRVFEFTNTGDAPLIITNVLSTCGCTVPTKPEAPYRDWETDRKSTRLNSSHLKLSRMPSSA